MYWRERPYLRASRLNSGRLRAQLRPQKQDLMKVAFAILQELAESSLARVESESVGDL